MKPDALETWKQIQHDLRRIVYRKVKDKSVADDIIQDVYIKAQENLSQLREKGKLASWIYQITRHMVMDYFRAHYTSSKQVEVDSESTHNELNECVSHCLNVLLCQLPEKYQLALRLTEFENLTQLELAKRLNISHSGARSRVQRARKILKDKIQAQYIIETDAYGNVVVCENRQPCCCRKEC
jgi:RNA polymerase sigma-70 factor, ECF subfamily